MSVGYISHIGLTFVHKEVIYNCPIRWDLTVWFMWQGLQRKEAREANRAWRKFAVQHLEETAV